MAAVTRTTLSAAFKRIYPQREVFNLALKENTLLAMLTQVDDFYGDGNYLGEPVQYGESQSRSRKLSAALATKSGGSYGTFALTRSRDYWTTDIEGEAIMGSQKEVGAFFEAKKREIDAGLRTLGRSAGKQVYGNGFGYHGVIASVSGSNITLATPADASNFEVNMYLVAADNNGTGGIPGDMRNNSQYAKVTAVDEDNGIITVDSLPAAWAADDYIFTYGDYEGGSTRTGIVGLQGYLPLWTSSALPGTLFGLSRDAHPTRLAGVPYDGTATGKQGSKTEVLMRHQARIARMGGMPPKIGMCNPEDYQDLVLEQQGKFVPATASVQVKFADQSSVNVEFNGVKIGNVEMYADVNCPKGRYFLLRLETWRLHTMGRLPHFIEDDGLFAVRSSNEDAIEVRARYFAQLGCRAPGWNGQGKWST